MVDPGQQASQRLYSAVASIDPLAIAPLIMPLVQDFIQAIPRPFLHGRALDVGTGLGFAAYQLATNDLSVLGLDLSPAMLRAATRRNDASHPMFFVGADIKQPPFAPASFDLIVASFGLNLTAPRQSLLLLRRLLKPGGGLFIQEWAAEDPLTVAFDDTFAAYTDSDATSSHFLADFDDLPDKWSTQMQDVDDYREQLELAGFNATTVSETVPVSVPLESAELFIAYKLAWPTYRYPWEALDAVAQKALQGELATVLQQYTQPNGQLLWQPSLFRAAATAPK
jgi:SAM-dependent methyltransferase